MDLDEDEGMATDYYPRDAEKEGVVWRGVRQAKEGAGETCEASRN